MILNCRNVKACAIQRMLDILTFKFNILHNKQNIPIAANKIWNSSEHFSLISEETPLIQFLFINLNGSFMKRTLCLPLHTFSIDFVIVDAMLHGDDDKNAWLLECSIKSRRLVSLPASSSLFCTGWNLQYDIWSGADVMLGVDSWVSPHESNDSFCLYFLSHLTLIFAIFRQSF